MLHFSGVAFASAPGSLSPEAALRLLHGSPEKTITDQSGYSFRFFKVTEGSELQTLIDTIHFRLVTTAIGSVICTDLLGGKPELLELHLGMSPKSSRLAAAECRRARYAHDGTPIVYNEPGLAPTRLTSTGAMLPRKYVIVVTNRPDFPIESWTESYANQTTLVVHHSTDRSDLNLRFLAQALAHEMAIYFDAKSWPWGPGWSGIPELGKIKLTGATHEQVAMAALNPAIGTVLSFIRAFKVERQMMRELVSQGRLGPDQIYYPNADFPFLRLGCVGGCLRDFVMAQQNWLGGLHRSLLAFSPHFLSRKIESERQKSSFNGPVSKDAFSEVLQSLPISYMRSMAMESAFENFILAPTKAEEEARAKTYELMMSAILPADLEILSQARFEFPESGRSAMDALTYLSVPLLSDLNSVMSSGPRPRIRTGGTR